MLFVCCHMVKEGGGIASEKEKGNAEHQAKYTQPLVEIQKKNILKIKEKKEWESLAVKS